MEFDTVIHGGTIVTPTESWQGDLGLVGGRIAGLAERLPGGARRIDATGRLVLPGGIEAHAHIAQESSSGLMSADDYYTGSVSAAFGGNSSFIPFAAQHRGQSVDAVIETYDSRAAPNSVLDYSYHLIISDPTETVLTEELPRAFARGITSFKVFMTYDLMNLGDRGMLDILTVARRHGALTMVHAENNDMVKWMNARLAAAGLTAPKYHAISRPALAEAEAINRAISLARLVGAGLFIVHVSTPEGADLVARAQASGLPIHAETCPQYLAFTRDDLDRPGMEGAKYICSPPPARCGDAGRALEPCPARHLRERVLGPCPLPVRRERQVRERRRARLSRHRERPSGHRHAPALSLLRRSRGRADQPPAVRGPLFLERRPPLRDGAQGRAAAGL